MQKLYSTLYKSCVRAVDDLVKDIRITMPDQDTLEYWTWEARLDEDQLPRVPLLGVNGFAFDENNGLWRVHCGLTISTVDDANLLIEADMIDMIHDRFGEGQKITLLDPDDASTINELLVAHFEVLPMGQTQMRNYRSIGLELLRTGV